MGLDIPFRIVLGYALGLILSYIVGWLFLVPLKRVSKLILNALVGGVVLWLLNLVGKLIHVTIAVNPLNAFIVGVLGIPGLILILLLQFIL